MERRVWFQLLDPDGNAAIDAASVMLSDEVSVRSLREAVMSNTACRHLFDVDTESSDLVVFADRSLRQPLASAYPIQGRGRNRESPFIVQIPLQSIQQVVQTPKPRWKLHQVRKSDFITGTIHFVNQETALKQLCEVHKASYIRSLGNNDAEPVVVALADNEIGLGKSAFGLNYINRCRKHWPDKGKYIRGFKKSLCASRTLHIKLKSQVFVARTVGCGSSESKLADALTEAMNDYLVRAVEKELDESVGTPLPPYLSNRSTSSDSSLVEAIVEDLGPVFIVIDNIGQGFKYEELDGFKPDAEAKSRELFMTFCSTVLKPWASIPGVYFVLMGYAPFLRNVQERTEAVTLTRLDLRLIRPMHIKEILRETWGDRNATESLAYRWGLHTRSRITSAAQTVYRKTCGRPLTIVTTFRQFATYDDYEPRGTEVRDSTRDPLHNYHLWKWLPLVKKWLPLIRAGTPIDLSMDWFERSQGLLVSFMKIAEGVGRDGEKNYCLRGAEHSDADSPRRTSTPALSSQGRKFHRRRDVGVSNGVRVGVSQTFSRAVFPSV